MTKHPSRFSRLFKWEQSWLLWITGAAILVGLYGRFVGLGRWPLGVDEFYISSSIDNILRTGLPEFLCGGYYTRGVLYQYIVAALRLTGLTPEFASRMVSALSSLAVLPAAYLLGRRLHGRPTGLLVVAILSVSIWEIEMARFARMYAPFQAVFAWYLVFFLRYVIDRVPIALAGMVAMSILGVLTWEGGALIGLLNFLPPFIHHHDGRLQRKDWWYLAAMSILFLLLYASTTDLRGLAEIPTLSQTTDTDTVGDYVEEAPIFAFLPEHPIWLVLAAVPFALGLRSLGWLWSIRTRWLAAFGLALVLVAALLGQLLVSASIALLLLLLRIVNPRELIDRRAVPFLLTIAVSLVFWVAFAVLTAEWRSSTPADLAYLVLMELAGFPDVLNQIVRPWGRTLPVLSIALCVAFIGMIFRAIRYENHISSMQVVLLVILLLGLAVGAATTPRIETRYTFFLYPVLLAVGITALGCLADSGFFGRRKTLVLALVGLLLFAATEDFKPHHVATIDSEKTNFRLGMSADASAHYYPRNNVQATADWLKNNVRDGDIVMTGVPNLYQYYRDVDYAFLNDDDDRYYAYACRLGTTDRWTNLPLIHSMNALEPLVGVHHRVFLVVYSDRFPLIREAAIERGWNYEGPIPTGGGTVVVLDRPRP